MTDTRPEDIDEDMTAEEMRELIRTAPVPDDASPSLREFQMFRAVHFLLNENQARLKAEKRAVLLSLFTILCGVIIGAFGHRDTAYIFLLVGWLTIAIRPY